MTWSSVLQDIPFRVISGRKPRLEWENKGSSERLTTEQMRELEIKCKKLRDGEIEETIKKGRTTKQLQIHPGDYVWWFSRGRGSKFSDDYGPYLVVEVRGNEVLVLRDLETNNETTASIRDVFYCKW